MTRVLAPPRQTYTTEHYLLSAVVAAYSVPPTGLQASLTRYVFSLCDLCFSGVKWNCIQNRVYQYYRVLHGGSYTRHLTTVCSWVLVFEICLDREETVQLAREIKAGLDHIVLYPRDRNCKTESQWRIVTPQPFDIC